MENDGSTEIPKKETEITKTWIERNTCLKPKDNSITVNGNIQAGVGFLSNLCRVSFQTEDGSTENILVKLLPENPEFRSLTMNQKFDQLEIRFYTLVKPELLEICPELQDNMCHYYGSKFIDSDNAEEYASMLIIEDLKPAGYQMLNPESDDWEAYLEKLMIFLAKFHATGLALEEKNNKKISELFPFCMGVDDSKLDMLSGLAIANAARLDEFLLKFNCPDEMRNAYAAAGNKIEEIMQIVPKKGSDFPLLIHGDTWPPNIMVCNAEAPIKMIDWQLLGYRDPNFELTIAILTCKPSKVMEKTVIEKFAKLYYQEFLKICNSKGLNANKRTEGDFLDFFNTWGMAYAYIWLLLSIDAFPNSEERLYDGFVLLHEKYNVSEVLLKEVNCL